MKTDTQLAHTLSYISDIYIHDTEREREREREWGDPLGSRKKTQTRKERVKTKRKIK
jgi:hypothetical protein